MDKHPTLCALLAAAAIFAGVVLVKNPSSPTSRPDEKPPAAGQYWPTIAELVEAGRVADSDRLCALIRRLKDHERLTAADLKRFDEAFPGLPAAPRKLTAADAVKLRSL